MNVSMYGLILERIPYSKWRDRQSVSFLNQKEITDSSEVTFYLQHCLVFGRSAFTSQGTRTWVTAKWACGYKKDQLTSPHGLAC